MSAPPTPELPADFQQAMKLFQQEFAAQLPGRLQEARQHFNACRQAPGDDERLRALHRCLHKLAGAAGTFALPQVTDDARAIESDLDVLLSKPARTAADLDAVGALLDGLERRALGTS
jgi:chemotaxis protein histidine kinase CheA